MADMRDGWVYAAQEYDSPLVKIGYSRNPEARIALFKAELGVSHTLIAAVYVRRLALKTEQRVHHLLAPQHIEREWFYLYMNQQQLARLVQQALHELLQEESQLALKRFQWHVRMRWRHPYRWLSAEDLAGLQRVSILDIEQAWTLPPREAKTYR